MNTYEQKLRDLEDRQRQAAADHSSIANEIEALREKIATPEPVIPWEPKSGGFYVGVSGVVDSLNTNHKYSALHTVGRTFQTEEAATKASESFTFYQRLYKLAEECDAKHTGYGYFHVRYSNINHLWYVNRAANTTKQEVTDLFTSESSAREACGIMNRDGWKLPTL